MHRMISLTNARMPDGRIATIRMHDGRINSIESTVEAPKGDQVIDAREGLVLPGLIDGHIHLDKTRLGEPWRTVSPAKTVTERIQSEREFRLQSDYCVQDAAEALLGAVLAHGTTTLRTHVDIDDVVGLKHLEIILNLRSAWADRITIQTVVFPQSGILSCRGASLLLEEGIRAGADLVGGLDPAELDGNVNGHLDVVFGLAEKYDRGIDIHIHEHGAIGLNSLTAVAERTEAAGLQGRVTVSHAFALASNDDDVRAVIRRLARCGVSVLSSVPGPIPCLPFASLRDAGVNVFFGTDNVRDSWSPYAVIGMLDRCFLAAYRSGSRTDKEITDLLHFVTVGSARALGVTAPSLGIGSPADLIVVDAQNVAQAVIDHPQPYLVIKAGRVVVGEGNESEHLPLQ